MVWPSRRSYIYGAAAADCSFADFSGFTILDVQGGSLAVLANSTFINNTVHSGTIELALDGNTVEVPSAVIKAQAEFQNSTVVLQGCAVDSCSPSSSYACEECMGSSVLMLMRRPSITPCLRHDGAPQLVSVY